VRTAVLISSRFQHERPCLVWHIHRSNSQSSLLRFQHHFAGNLSRNGLRRVCSSTTDQRIPRAEPLSIPL
jgi:hypothetical protein